MEDRARLAHQSDREQIAGERATALESKLSRLELKVPSGRQLPGLEVLLAGTVVPRASWNAALPVDPGSLKIEARAPGRKPWVTELTIAPGATRKTLEIPELALAPRKVSQSAPGASAASASSPMRTAGIVVGAAGLLALGAGGYFGYRAYSRNQDSKGECRADSPNACTLDGARLREEASDAARLSTIFSLSGAGLFAAGVTLVITAPSPIESRAGGERQAAWGAQVGGVW